MLDRTTTQLFEAPGGERGAEYVCRYVTWRKPDDKDVRPDVWRVVDNDSGEVIGVINVGAFKSATEFDAFMREFIKDRTGHELASPG